MIMARFVLFRFEEIGVGFVFQRIREHCRLMRWEVEWYGVRSIV